jgi:hypothetical protein
MAALNQISYRVWNETPAYTNTSLFTTKMYQFGGPNIKKSINKIILTATGTNAGLVVEYRTSIGDSFKTYNTAVVDATTDTYSISPGNNGIADDLKNVNSVQFRFRLGCIAANPITIDDVNIVYRQYRNISINEDER